jgi:hypothetical protein
LFEFILESLLSTLGAPFLAAVTRGKKSSQKKAKKNRPVTASRKIQPVKKSASSQARKSTRGVPKKSEKPTREKKAAARERTAPVAVSSRKSADLEPAVKPIPPSGRAILLSPENEKFSDSLHPTFRWLSVGSATRYEVAWSEQADLTQSHSVVSIAT